MRKLLASGVAHSLVALMSHIVTKWKYLLGRVFPVAESGSERDKPNIACQLRRFGVTTTEIKFQHKIEMKRKRGKQSITNG